jgi:hypothetical protein
VPPAWGGALVDSAALYAISVSQVRVTVTLSCQPASLWSGVVLCSVLKARSLRSIPTTRGYMPALSALCVGCCFFSNVASGACVAGVALPTGPTHNPPPLRLESNPCIDVSISIAIIMLPIKP